MRKGSNLFLQLIILSMDQFAQNLRLSGLFGTKVAYIAISSSLHRENDSI